MIVAIEAVIQVYTNSVSSKYTLDPIHRTMKSTGTPVTEIKTSVSEMQTLHTKMAESELGSFQCVNWLDEYQFS